MGFLDLFRSSKGNVAVGARPRASAIETLDLTDPRVAQYLRGGMSTESGATVTPVTALAVATAYACTRIICSAVKTLPMDLKRREGNSRLDATDSPLWDLLRRRPNKWQTPSEFKQLMQMCVLLRGNGYAYIQRSRGRIRALIPLLGSMVVTQNDDLSLTYIHTALNGTKTPFAQEDIFHLRGMTMDGIVGLSVISFARETLGLSIQSEKHAAKLFKNGTAIGSVIEHGKELSDPEIARLKATLEEFRGAENAHKNLVLENGMKFAKVDMSPVDMQFIQNREISQTEIAMFFGVPPHMLGLTTKSTSWGSGIEQQGIGFIAYTLQDWLTMWEEAIARDLVPSSEPTMYVRLNPAGLVRADIKTRYLAYAVGRQWGWLSANDVREKEDDNPITGGDVYLQAINMVDATKATEALAAHDPNASQTQD